MARGRAVRGGWQKLEVYSGAGAPRCVVACMLLQRAHLSVGAPQMNGRTLSLLLMQCWTRVRAQFAAEFSYFRCIARCGARAAAAACL